MSLVHSGASAFIPTDQTAMAVLAWADTERHEAEIEAVTERGEGYEISQGGGWICWLEKAYGVEPTPGETLTMWGKRFGVIRGMAVGKRVAFYRSASDQKAHSQIQTYGADAADWLRKWDAGEGVWTITMGGLSAGYDQAINLIAAEFIRALIKLAPDKAEWSDDLRPMIDAECAEAVSHLGLSGAQYGVALSFAWRLYRDGPIKAVAEAPDDRRIQASKGYPTLDPIILAALDAEKARTAVEGPSVGTGGEAEREPKSLPTNGDSQ